MTNEDRIPAKLAALKTQANGFALVHDDGTCFIRRARKEYRCRGGYDREQRRRVPCSEPIMVGSLHVEYVGDSAPFESGKRYHFECAEQQGLVTRTA